MRNLLPLFVLILITVSSCQSDDEIIPNEHSCEVDTVFVQSDTVIQRMVESEYPVLNCDITSGYPFHTVVDTVYTTEYRTSTRYFTAYLVLDDVNDSLEVLDTLGDKVTGGSWDADANTFWQFMGGGGTLYNDSLYYWERSPYYLGGTCYNAGRDTTIFTYEMVE